MKKQQLFLFLEVESDTDVWPSIPETDQKEAIEQFSRLILYAAEGVSGTKTEESQDRGKNNE